MSATNQPVHPKLHLSYLDSVRGLAALSVVVYHFINWRYESLTAVKLATVFINGSDAVAFFFVLSGFVLSYKYLVLQHDLDIGKFYINRFFRLWPAFFVTIIINALYVHWEGMGVQKLLDLFVHNKYRFWEEAVLLRSMEFKYYLPEWTLIIEFILSLFVPFAVVLAHKDKKLLWWLLAFYLLGMGNMAGITKFLNHFIMGGLMAAYYHFITSGDFKQTRLYKYRWLILALAFFMFSMRHIDSLYKLKWYYDSVIFSFFGYDFYFFSGVASFIFLVFIMHSTTTQRILEFRLLRFLGKLSYGIYLMHWLVVVYIYEHWEMLTDYFPNTATAFVVLFILCMAVTIALALVVYHFIELPFIRWGKKLTSNMRSTFVISLQKKDE